MTSKTFKVFVTGFGANHNAPYGNATSNPSSLIAEILPKSLDPSDPLNTSKAPINIQTERCASSYGPIRQWIIDAHAKYGDKVDLWIHLGRGPWDFVSCERHAFRQDFTCSWLTEAEHEGYYNYRHNDGKTAAESEECPWIEKKVPIGLNSEIDINSVVKEANEALGKQGGELKVQSHLEGGAAGCGYTFYESMANCFVAGRKRDVLFCHVPRGVDEESIEKAKVAVLAIIGASVGTLIEREKNKDEEVDWKQRFGQVP